MQIATETTARRDRTMNGRVGPLLDLALKRIAASPSEDASLALAAHFGGSGDELALLELDPLVQVTAMDDAAQDIGLPAFQANHVGLDGSGVTVAVLDSGIDPHHPYLSVADSVSTCGESIDIPGSHGTHCAGSVASTDSYYPGVAPGVSLLNIKVLTADGRGKHTYITAGIDEALDRGAHVLSMSVGFNHLPTWSSNGHGWSCSDGRCPLCTAVDNASALDNAVVVVAAGNEHERAEALRKWGYGLSFDTELGCPGHARSAVTVAALTKNLFLPAPFSSHGPTAYGSDKPDLAAPGVNITSTIPVPRLPNGQPEKNPSRSKLFGRKSGTSMATPIVAGAAALLVQMAQQKGIPWTSNSIKRRLMTDAVLPVSGGPAVTGAGRLDLSGL
jgi:serine protease AprX